MHIYNFHKISDMLACSGQPTEEQLKELAVQQYQVVVNLGLSDTKHSLPDEVTSVKLAGMDYCHIPVVFDSPQIDDLTAFIEFMDDQAGKKTLVHCVANYRATCFIGLYLYYKAKFTEDEALSLAEEMWQPDAVWQLFFEECIAYIDSISN